MEQFHEVRLRAQPLLAAADAACSSNGAALPTSATPKITNGVFVLGSVPQ